MPSQQQIDRFTLAFHQEALARLRSNQHLLSQALDTLARWHAQRGHTASEPYFAVWRKLLQQGPDAVQSVVCQNSDYAAAMRNVSPLGFVLSPSERAALRQAAKIHDES